VLVPVALVLLFSICTTACFGCSSFSPYVDIERVAIISTRQPNTRHKPSRRVELCIELFLDSQFTFAVPVNQDANGDTFSVRCHVESRSNGAALAARCRVAFTLDVHRSLSSCLCLDHVHSRQLDQTVSLVARTPQAALPFGAIAVAIAVAVRRSIGETLVDCPSSFVVDFVSSFA
jgi:hypothetical protein